jgi:rRNA maturation endonuclease Nob1
MKRRPNDLGPIKKCPHCGGPVVFYVSDMRKFNGTDEEWRGRCEGCHQSFTLEECEDSSSSHGKR